MTRIAGYLPELSSELSCAVTCAVAMLCFFLSRFFFLRHWSWSCLWETNNVVSKRAHFHAFVFFFTCGSSANITNSNICVHIYMTNYGNLFNFVPHWIPLTSQEKAKARFDTEPGKLPFQLWWNLTKESYQPFLYLWGKRKFTLQEGHQKANMSSIYMRNFQHTFFQRVF